MNSRMASWFARPGFMRALISQVRLAARLLREPSVPAPAKAVPLLGALYLIWPLDGLPDILPFLGQLDDLGVAVAALEVFVRLCPPAAVVHHRDAIAAGRPYSPMPHPGSVIDAEFRRL